MAMIEPVLHLFKIHRKMISGNSSIAVQNVFSVAPKSLNAIDVIFAAVGKSLAMIQAVMLAQPLQGIIAPKRVGVIDRSFSRFLPDDRHEFLFRHMLHHPRIHFAITLKKAKNNVFARCAPAALAFPSATKVALVHLDLAIESAAFKFGNMVDRFAEFLINARHRLVVEAEIIRDTVSRLLLIEPRYDGNFRSDTLQRFLFSTAFIWFFLISSG